MPNDIHQTVVDLADAGERFALVVVLKDAGSTPRKAGTKCVIDRDGTIHGTIGGGLLEDEARRVALRAMGTRRAEVFDFRFDGKSAREGDPVCGGTVRVLVDPTSADHRAAYAAAAEARRSRRRGSLVTAVRNAGTDATRETQVSVRWIAGDRTDATANDATNDPVDTLIEPLVPPPLLLVVGGGHVGQALARQAVLVGFDVVVIEDRPEFAEPSRFPGALTVRCGNVAEELRTFPLDVDSYVALVSRGHRTDAAALAACIREPALAYVGMMGSRRKVALLRKEFVETGVATAEQFDRVRAPIGLDIGAETVPEIAASIVAELVAVLRKRDTRASDPAARRKVALR
jgi:xanthine dehydrogenase accessory factor